MMMIAFILPCVMLTVSAASLKIEHPNSHLIDETEQKKMGRIVNGTDVEISEYPWQASLRYRQGGSSSHICGAAIISKNWLVCAAHCTQNPLSGYSIYVGSADRVKGGQVYDIKRIINHDSYGTGNGLYPNDISLIELSRELVFNDNVGAIKLSNSDPTGSDCNISGWGRTCGTCSNTRLHVLDGNVIETGFLPVVLQAAKMTVLSNNDCKGYFGSSIASGHICIHTAGEESACNGDSGGPMSCPDGNNGHFLAGVTSFGYNGCPAGQPSVYTRISSYRSFIHDNTGL